MKFHKLTSCLFIGSALTLSACSVSNVGEIDYRRADAGVTAFTGEKQDGAYNLEAPQCALDDIGAPDCAATPLGEEKVLFWPSRLLNRDMKGRLGFDNPIKKDDNVAVRLRSVYIGRKLVPENFITELGLSSAARGEAAVYLETGKTNLEIAVVANAFQLAGGDRGDFNFDNNSLSEARVVYFSDDVTPGQFLNMNNMLIYGPKKFEGAGIGLTLGVIEMDVEDARQIELLESLAGFGGKAFPAIAPAAGILNSIGGALLGSGNNNDIMFRYDQALDPEDSSTRLNFSRLEEGNYVFVRDHNRARSVPWERLFLDDNTAELWECAGSAPSRCARYTDGIYMVIQIARSAASYEVALAQNTLNALEEALSGTEDNEAFKKGVEEIEKQIDRNRLDDEAVALAASARASYQELIRVCGERTPFNANCFNGNDRRSIRLNNEITAHFIDLQGHLKAYAPACPGEKNADAARKRQMTGEGLDATLALLREWVLTDAEKSLVSMIYPGSIQLRVVENSSREKSI